MRSAEEILEREANREKAVYMDQRSYQSGVVLRSMKAAQKETLQELRRLVLAALWNPSEDFDLVDKVFSICEKEL